MMDVCEASVELGVGERLSYRGGGEDGVGGIGLESVMLELASRGFWRDRFRLF